jgi:hypothetical protein
MTRLLVAASAVVVTLAVGVAPAGADFGLQAFDGSVTANDPDGNPGTPDGDPYTQAGGHPYEASTTFKLNTTTGPEGVLPDGALRNVSVDLPPGLIGDPTAVPKCDSPAKLLGDFLDPTQVCPLGSIVGIVGVESSLIDDEQGGELAVNYAPIFNMEPRRGVPAQFGFAVLETPTLMTARLRKDGEYALSIDSRFASQGLAVTGVTATFWGVPADQRHDSQRCYLIVVGTTCIFPPGHPLGANPSPLPPRAFLSLPTSCTPDGVGVETDISVDSWQRPSQSASASFISHDPPGYTLSDPRPPEEWGPPQGPTGCDQVPFDPSFRAQPDSSTPDSPSGLRVDLGFPQDGLSNPEGFATAHLRDTTVTLPEGMTINPSGANGLEACTNAQVDFDSIAPIACPEASKIATVSATTPVLEEELSGAVYVGSQLSDNPESGDMFRIILALENAERGIFVKLLGNVRADAQTGRLVTTFAGNPQLPVSTISLHFKHGPRAPLAMPPDCGTKTVDATMTSWAGHLVRRMDSFNVQCTPDLGGFAPAFQAGTVNPVGGAFSPFVVRINRADRQQYMSGLTVEMPPGLIGKLKDVPLCPDAQANAGTCGIESRIGTATVGAGPGSNPFFIDGSVSLTGPYKGAPFGLSTAVRVIAGPFDLGMVVVRQAIHVDPVDAHITVVSDPLPVIVKGVPVRLRSINVDVKRPGFTLNPTSCGPKQIKATMISTTGAIHQATQHFQVGDCQALPLRPRLRMRLTGRKQLRDKGHPGVRAVLTQGPGQANLKQVRVKLPLSLALDPNRAQSDDLCEFEAGQRVDCPASSIIGRARAFTPVLNRPLTGPVYFVKNVRVHPRTGNLIRTLPTLLIPLKGEVDIHLRAQSDTQRGKLVNTFSAVPDAPVSRFELALRGGRRGILIVNGNPCRRNRIADVQMDGQNGKRADRGVRIGMPCAKKRKRANAEGEGRNRARNRQGAERASRHR